VAGEEERAREQNLWEGPKFRQASSSTSNDQEAAIEDGIANVTNGVASPSARIPKFGPKPPIWQLVGAPPFATLLFPSSIAPAQDEYRSLTMSPSNYGISLFLLISALCTGCGGDSETGPHVQGPETAKGVLKKMHQAYIESNKSRFLECFVGPKPHLEVADALFDHWEAANAFEVKVRKAYGVEGWETYKEGRGIVVNAPPKDPSWVDHLRVETVGLKKVEVSDPGGSLEAGDLPMVIVRQKGCWWVDASSLVPAGAKTETWLKYSVATTDAIEDVLPLIGTPEFSLEDLQRVMEHKAKDIFSILALIPKPWLMTYRAEPV